MEEIRVSPDYNWFRCTVPLKRVSNKHLFYYKIVFIITKDITEINIFDLHMQQSFNMKTFNKSFCLYDIDFFFVCLR